MSEFTPRVGSFTAYLESARKRKSDVTSPSVTPISVLEILSRQPQRAMAMTDLETLSGMDSARFRNVLKSLADMAYVTVEGPAVEAAVALTEKGAEAAVLARPA
jgi:predicted transcriptional regulator